MLITAGRIGLSGDTTDGFIRLFVALAAGLPPQSPSPTIPSTKRTNKRLNLASSIFVNALTSFTPSEVARKSETRRARVRALPGVARDLRSAFEEVWHRDLEDMTHRLQPAGADAVAALFVFLHLLEGYPELICKVCLAHVEHQPAHAHPAPDIFVGGVGRFRGHCVLRAPFLFRFNLRARGPYAIGPSVSGRGARVVGCRCLARLRHGVCLLGRAGSVCSGARFMGRLPWRLRLLVANCLGSSRFIAGWVVSIAYPLRHISLRVPWHDTAWDGRVCANPRLNSSCLKLRRIAEGRNDAAEENIKARLLSDLPESQWPCCIGEGS